jgi:hypothetical protein
MAAAALYRALIALPHRRSLRLRDPRDSGHSLIGSGLLAPVQACREHDS